MPKKKILFVLDSLIIGGAEKSLVTLLTLMDFSKYEVDLQLFEHSGAFMIYVPQEVNILPLPRWCKFTQQPLRQQLFSYEWKMLLTRLRLAIGLRTKPLVGRERDVFFWKTISSRIENNPKHYD